MLVWIGAFRSQFTAPSWQHVLVLTMGCILAPGKRTVTACLRMTGRTSEPGFAKYHHVLNRARWNPRALARLLLKLIVARLVPEGPIVIGLDDTIERRWGRRITARGIYVTLSAPAMAISSKPAACGGSALWCWRLCHGRVS